MGSCVRGVAQKKVQTVNKTEVEDGGIVEGEVWEERSEIQPTIMLTQAGRRLSASVEWWLHLWHLQNVIREWKTPHRIEDTLSTLEARELSKVK